MSIRHLSSFIVPVTGESNPPNRTILEEQPDAGARWGRKAAFAFSSEGVLESGPEGRGFGFKANIDPDAPPVKRVPIGGTVNVTYFGRKFIDEE